MPKAFLNGINLYYEQHGSGLPIVLANGSSGTTRSWDPQIPALSKRHRLILYDLRGHGQTDSPRDISRYSMDIVVEDQYQLLRHLGVGQAVMAGISVGGMIAMHFYLKHPQMTRALILINTGPGFRNPERRARWREDRIRLAGIFEAGGMEAFMASPFSKDSYYTTPEVMRSLDPVGQANFQRGVSADLPLIPVEQIRVPTLIILGENDAGQKPGSEYMSQRIPGARLVVIPRSGHGVNVDEPELFNRAILEFLKETGV
ncbi:MAG: alpha/beta fold hydrolase [Chloroflexi bacterium]|nr:alpha/beta fold hydrolase [Chloroflexota bacterium]